MCGTHLGYKFRKARKEHACLACDIVIPPGFRYVVSVDVDDGKARSSKWHEECWDEFVSMLQETHEDCGMPDWTWDSRMMPVEIKMKYIFGPPEPTEKQWDEMEVDS